MGDGPAQRVGIADVAREAGVSKSAVSFAFNRPDRLNPETAARIRDVAERLGYRPHPVARMLTAGQTATIGILSPQTLSTVFANPFFALFAEGVATVIEERGYGLTFISPLEGSLARAVGQAIVDGIIVVGLDERHPEVRSIRTAGRPMVLVDAPAWPEHGSILVDDEGGARAAARHLIDLGHREFLVISMEPPPRGDEEPDTERVMSRRLRGYRAELHAAGVELGDERIVMAPATVDGGEAALRDAWENGLRPTAVLSMSDAAAAGVLLAAQDLGLAVPEDLSVVGFDDLPLTRSTSPPLSTVHQPVRRKGAEAALMLLRALDASTAGSSASHLVLDTRLIVRRSTAVAAGAHRQEVVAAG